MKGVILHVDYSQRGGLISGENGIRYMFSYDSWREQRPPHREARVDFLPDGDIATEIFLDKTVVDENSEKNKLVALLLCLFFGFLGVHRFYVGKIGTGILQFVTIGMFGIWTLVDLILILFGEFRDIDGNKLV